MVQGLQDACLVCWPGSVSIRHGLDFTKHERGLLMIAIIHTACNPVVRDKGSTNFMRMTVRHQQNLTSIKKICIVSWRVSPNLECLFSMLLKCSWSSAREEMKDAKTEPEEETRQENRNIIDGWFSKLWAPLVMGYITAENSFVLA